jgi:Fe-S-cluster containining protein
MTQPAPERGRTVTGPGGIPFPASQVLDQSGPANLLGGCAGCGSCCSNLTISFSPDQIREAVLLLDAADADAAAGEPHPDYSEQERRNIRWLGQLIEKGPRVLGQHAYSCPMLDPISRLCTAHERRPQVCIGFPFYGRSPADDPAEMSDGCSYQWELPVELRAPLTGGLGTAGWEGPTGPVGRLIPLWPA